MRIFAWYRGFIVAFSVSWLTACSGSGGGGHDDEPAPSPVPSTHAVGGAVTGLSGSSVVLRNNGGDSLTVSSSGEFSFATPIAQGSSYNVTVATQPSGKICEVSYGSGTVGGGAIENVAVSCINSLSMVEVNGTNTLSSTHKPTLVGVVIDSAVVNLNYDGPGPLDGATNSFGQFNYQPGELITFKIGDIALPAVSGQPVITLFNFAGSNDINNTTLVNIARFLQSLDSDGNPDNGITISAQAHTAATGHSLDFSSPSFDATANPIIAATFSAGGTPNNSLISGSTAIAHVQSTIDNLPKQAPIAGAWMVGAGTGARALILLENGQYYGAEGNCAATGKPTYEFGTWAYNGSTLTLAVSKDGNSTCGLGTGSRAATVSGNSLTLDGATWADVSYSETGLSGFYAYKAFISDEDFELILFTDTQYIVLGAEDLGTASEDVYVLIGTYAWGGNASPSFTSTHVAVLSNFDQVGDTDTNAVTRYGSSLLFNDAGSVFMYGAVRPAKVSTSLAGLWQLDESGDIADTELAYPLVFTPSGKAMYLGNDASCPGIVNGSGSGEIGNYAWDTVTNAFSLTITGDSNGACGIAADAAGIQSATVTGNLLTFNSVNGSGVSIRPSNTTVTSSINNIAGIWKQTSGSGALTLLITQNLTNVNLLTIRALDSDCPNAGTSYAVESLNATVSAPNNIVQTAASTNYDTAACGLPATLGPTYSIVGDTLTLGGIGTFIRQ